VESVSPKRERASCDGIELLRKGCALNRFSYWNDVSVAIGGANLRMEYTDRRPRVAIGHLDAGLQLLGERQDNTRTQASLRRLSAVGYANAVVDYRQRPRAATGV